MDNIFNSNKKLEDLLFYALDRGLFLRSDTEGQLTPFMLLQNEGKISFRVMVTDDNPVDYAKTILAKEIDPFQQFAIGFEAYLNDDGGNRTDAIIVKGFDVTQHQGTVLGQMFSPKEKGGFSKINKITFLGNPDLIVAEQVTPTSSYQVIDVEFNPSAILKESGLISYTAVVAYTNPSIIGNTIKNFLKNKLSGDNQHQLSGAFEFEIIKDNEVNTDFLKFIIVNAITESLKSEVTDRWLKAYQRNLEIICKQNGEIIVEARKKPKKVVMPDIDVPEVSTKKWWEFWKS